MDASTEPWHPPPATHRQPPPFPLPPTPPHQVGLPPPPTHGSSRGPSPVYAGRFPQTPESPTLHVRALSEEFGGGRREAKRASLRSNASSPYGHRSAPPLSIPNPFPPPSRALPSPSAAATNSAGKIDHLTGRIARHRSPHRLPSAGGRSKPSHAPVAALRNEMVSLQWRDSTQLTINTDTLAPNSRRGSNVSNASNESGVLDPSQDHTGMSQEYLFPMPPTPTTLDSTTTLRAADTPSAALPTPTPSSPASPSPLPPPAHTKPVLKDGTTKGALPGTCPSTLLANSPISPVSPGLALPAPATPSQGSPTASTVLSETMPPSLLQPLTPSSMAPASLHLSPLDDAATGRASVPRTRSNSIHVPYPTPTPGMDATPPRPSVRPRANSLPATPNFHAVPQSTRSLPLPTAHGVHADADRDPPPSQLEIWEAAQCPLWDEDGNPIRFGDILPAWPRALRPSQRKGRPPRTVVLFLRLFWCGMCQDYITESIARLDPAAIAAADVNVVLVTNGHWKLLRKYRQMLKCAFPIYTDMTRDVYTALGLKYGWGQTPPKDEKAAYNVHSVASQTVRGISRGIIKLPKRNPGNAFQLGGEFVFSPGYQCDFAHRMTNRFDHIEAPDVLRAAGVAYPTREERSAISAEQRAELESLEHAMSLARARRATVADAMIALEPSTSTMSSGTASASAASASDPGSVTSYDLSYYGQAYGYGSTTSVPHSQRTSASSAGPLPSTPSLQFRPLDRGGRTPTAGPRRKRFAVVERLGSLTSLTSSRVSLASGSVKSGSGIAKDQHPDAHPHAHALQAKRLSVNANKPLPTLPGYPRDTTRDVFSLGLDADLDEDWDEDWPGAEEWEAEACPMRRRG